MTWLQGVFKENTWKENGQYNSINGLRLSSYEIYEFNQTRTILSVSKLNRVQNNVFKIML